MKTLFFRFEDEAAAGEALAPFADTALVLDVVGEIYARTGEMIETDDGLVPEMAPTPGWYVNALSDELPAALAPFEVWPASPSREFAVEPAALRVPQEVTMAQCRLALFDQHAIETDEQFYALVDMLPEGEQARALLELRTRPTVRRDHALVQLLGQSMDWDLDALFVYAGGL